MTTWISIGSFLMALAVSAGAFGAHALKGRLDEYALSVYEKAVFYHFVHALGILLVAGLLAQSALANTALQRVNCIFLFGIIVFCGSLYALALSGTRWLGAITPIGGVAFIIAWVLLGISALKR